ncbi:uncharacterized protein LOC140702177 [Pogona vitticeps]
MEERRGEVPRGDGLHWSLSEDSNRGLQRKTKDRRVDGCRRGRRKAWTRQRRQTKWPDKKRTCITASHSKGHRSEDDHREGQKRRPWKRRGERLVFRKSKHWVSEEERKCFDQRQTLYFN